MGNCQAAEAATAVLQHPDGKVERLYWPTTAVEVMRANPSHYVALATTISLTNNHHQDAAAANPPSTSTSTSTTAAMRLTKLRLLRPKESLVLGQVYRLVTSQEVVKALKARKQERIRKQQQQQQLQMKTMMEEEHVIGDEEQIVQEGESAERHRQKAAQPAARARQWRPSLQSISEAMS